jgi:hypothetical protein
MSADPPAHAEGPPADDERSVPSPLREAADGIEKLWAMLPTWLAVEQERERTAVRIGQLEREQRALRNLASLDNPPCWISDELSALRSSEVADRLELAELKERQERHAVTTAQLRAHGRILRHYARRRGIGAEPLRGLLAGDLGQYDNVRTVLYKILDALADEAETIPPPAPTQEPTPLATARQIEPRDSPRPDQPTVAYCLAEPHTVRWENDPVKLKGVPRDLLQRLLVSIEHYRSLHKGQWWETWSVPIMDIAEVFIRKQKNVSPSRVKNVCSELNNILRDIAFPYEFSYRDECIRLLNDPA